VTVFPQSELPPPRAPLGRRLALAAMLLAIGDLAAAAAELHQIIQKGRAFNMPALEIDVGDTVRFTNEDQFLHQIYVKSDTFNYESAEQPPGEVVDIHFTVKGSFEVQCEIHPKMHLAVTVK
jgi:plastocyanin